MSMFYELMMKKKGMPSRYQEVEYIESTGTQYIDTGIKPTSATEMAVTMKTTSEISCGSRISASSEAFVIYSRQQELNYWFTLGNYTKPYDVHGTPNQKHTFKMSASQTSCWVDEVLKKSDLPSFSGNGFNIYLFRFNNGGTPTSTGTGTLYSCKIWDNGRLVRNFIPVYDTLTQKYGMWESVERKFYGNDGTGDFGGSIVGYTIVGSPTIVDGVVSGFSSSDYLSAGQILTTSVLNSVTKYKSVIKFTTGNSVSVQQGIAGLAYSFFGGYIPSSGKFKCPISDIVNGENSAYDPQAVVTLQPNTTYWTCLEYENNTITWKISTNGTTWETWATLSGVDSLRGQATDFLFGKTSHGYFYGSIDMNETYIKKDGKLWFNGQQA